MICDFGIYDFGICDCEVVTIKRELRELICEKRNVEIMFRDLENKEIKKS